MKITTTGFFSVIATLGIIAAVSSCAQTERFAGTWQSHPERMENVPGAAYATSTISIDFAPSASDKTRGDVDIMAVMEVQQMVESSSSIIEQPYQTNITATATIKGLYTRDGDDDVTISLDASSLKVNVDPSGVSFSENLVTGTERPQLDSLTASAAEKWRLILTTAIRDRFNSYRKIDNIKVHHGDMMSCEIAGRDLSFRRIGVPD